MIASFLQPCLISYGALSLITGNVTTSALVFLTRARLTAFEKRSFTSSLPCRVPRWMFHRGTHNFCTATMYARSSGLGMLPDPAVWWWWLHKGWMRVDHSVWAGNNSAIGYCWWWCLNGCCLYFHLLALTIADRCWVEMFRREPSWSFMIMIGVSIKYFM